MTSFDSVVSDPASIPAGSYTVSPHHAVFLQ